MIALLPQHYPDEVYETNLAVNSFARSASLRAGLRQRGRRSFHSAPILINLRQALTILRFLLFSVFQRFWVIGFWFWLSANCQLLSHSSCSRSLAANSPSSPRLRASAPPR